MTEYVVGFMFDQNKVALVRKNRPSWQKNKLNGIGGHVEPGELHLQAMAREFEEETGYKTYACEWEHFCTLSGEDWTVSFYYNFGDTSMLQTTTDEEIVVIPISEVTVENSITNLTWLIPMAKSMARERAKHFSVKENY